MVKKNYIKEIFYCFPAFAFAIPTFPVMILLPALYVEEYGISVAMIGIVIFLAKIIDIISDPIMGWICDKSIFNRKFLMFFGAIISGISIYLLFFPFIIPGPFYLGIMITFLYTGWTIFQVPYLSFGYDLESDYQKRTRLSGTREIFILLGLSTSVSLPFVLNDEYSTERILTYLAIYSGILSLAVFFFYVEEPKKRKNFNNLKILSSISKNFVLIRLISSWFINSLANVFPMILFVFFVTYVLGADEKTREKILFFYFFSAVIGMPIWIFVNRFIDKHLVWSISMILSSIFFSFVFFLEYGDIIYFIIISCLTGFCLGADLAIPPSMQSDVIDYQKLEFKQDISGIFFSLLTFINKIAFGLASLISFSLLDSFGFEPDEKLTKKTEILLFILYAGIPISLKLLSAYIIKSYPLSRQKTKKITKKLLG